MLNSTVKFQLNNSKEPTKNVPVTPDFSENSTDRSDNVESNNPLHARNSTKHRNLLNIMDDQFSDNTDDYIPDVYKTQGSMPYSPATGYSSTICPCSTPLDANETKKIAQVPDRRNWIATERLFALRKKAQEAIRNHKTFAIRGCFYSIRKSLIQRGWVEKLDIHRRTPLSSSQPCHDVVDDMTNHLPVRRPGETRRQHMFKCERNIMSRFLEHKPIDFLWATRKERQDWVDIARNPSITVNKFHRSTFSTKEGLCNILRDFHWHFQEGISETYSPRTYNVWQQDGLAEFVEDFHLTACISVLRYLNENVKEHGLNSLISSEGSVPASIFNFAIKQCRNYLRTCHHFDIDEDLSPTFDHEWDLFLGYFQQLTNEKKKIRIDHDTEVIRNLLPAINEILEELKPYWPHYNADGYLNIWIIKPSNRCRGRGIVLMSDVKKIINFVNPPVVNKTRYVVQKYVERPLIIYNCKFDIRQWFLVTSVQPLIVWMYKECYLRFSSQEFTLKHFHESVHLTNHAVQKRYKNGKRDERLPRDNMWDCHSFQAYLRQIGKAEMWSERIYPGMQRALIGLLLAAQDTMDRRSNTFELYGADFVIADDCQPWLLEINSSPDLCASSSVTARLCPQALEDVIKVVIDYRNNPKASTGGFELIYKQVIPPAPAYLGLNLFLKGTAIPPTKPGTAKKEKNKEISRYSATKLGYSALERKINNLTFNCTQPVMEKKPVLMDFIETINRVKSEKPAVNVRRPNKIKCLITSKKSKDLENMVTHQRAKSSDPTGTNSFVSRYLNILNDNVDMKSRSSNYAKRHASCGTKLCSVLTTSTPTTNKLFGEKENDADNNVAFDDKLKTIECVGNRCCMKNLPLINIQPQTGDKTGFFKKSVTINRLKPVFPARGGGKSSLKKMATKGNIKKSQKSGQAIKT